MKTDKCAWPPCGKTFVVKGGSKPTKTCCKEHGLLYREMRRAQGPQKPCRPSSYIDQFILRAARDVR